MKRKFLSTILALVMVLTLLPVTALAEGNVAKIGETEYATLQAAVEAAATDGTETTITLIGNVDGGTLTPSDSAVTVATIAADQNIVLDLAGYTISAALNTNGSNYAKAHVILNNGTLTIKDSSEGHTGTITNSKTNSNACTRTVKNNGTLTVNGGTISGTVALLNLGTCVIEGEHTVIQSEASFGPGGWDNSSAAIEHRTDPGAGTLTIKNATVSSISRAAIFCDGDTQFYIQGGTFTGNTAFGAVNGSTADKMAVITGGSFSSDPTDLIDQTAYVVADRPNGYYEVVKLGTPSDVTVSNEADLLAQLDAASYAAPLNITITGNVTLNRSAELLSGSTLTIDNGASLTVAEDVVFTQSGLITNNGTLTVNGFLTNPLNLSGNGTITNLNLNATNYELKTAMDLQWLTYLVEYGKVQHVTLANDIAIPSGVEFQMIGVANNGFYGNSDSDRNTFDGQNHTITGLRFSSTSSDVGLFPSLMYADIKNLTVEVDTVSNTGYTGGITGYAVEGVTFQNVTVRGSVKVTGGSYGCAAIAASVGYKDSQAGNVPVYFINCRNEASVGGTYGMNIGSIFGTASGSDDDVYVYNCSNTGAITAAGSMGYVFGYGHLNGATLEIIGFTNSGTVNGNAGSISSAAGSGFTYNTANAGSEWIAVKNNDGTWVAQNKSDYAAMVAGIPYADLSSAISAAQNGDTVTLLEAYNGEEMITISKVITIDLSETGTTSDKFVPAEAYQMTISGTKLVFSLKTHTVTFNSKGGSAVDPVTVEHNSAVAKPADPTRIGYTFGGWYSDEGLTTVYDFSSSVTSNITLYAKWTSTGGGSSSGSSDNKTETTTNPDGSTTTTVTNPDGSKTETTKNPDGSTEVVNTDKAGTVTTTTTDTAGNKTEVVENTDGSSKTTVTNKDGSSSTTTVDENGKTEAQVKLPDAVVNDAAGKGEAVTLPMPEVPATTERETAPTVTMDLPSGTSAKVEIPVAEVTPGTVAVIVKADGNEEVIKTSITTETGVVVTLSDGDTVKIVDNSKTFDDVADNYWGAEAVDFATSRELFAGTSATTFAPDTAMTRAMIVTVLARFEGVDTTNGDTWYEAGQQWAMENGISDGTGMDQGLSREQLATMLWRYAGSPSVSNDLSGYTDAGAVSAWAEDAMAWCVEQGIISGTTTPTLSPQGEATRAQVAAILMRFLQAGA